MNSKPHLTPQEFDVLKSIAEGSDMQDSASEESLQRLLSLSYIRAVNGRYILTTWGDKRSRSEGGTYRW
jgi:hypothetical protein